MGAWAGCGGAVEAIFIGFWYLDLKTGESLVVCVVFGEGSVFVCLSVLGY